MFIEEMSGLSQLSTSEQSFAGDVEELTDILMSLQRCMMMNLTEELTRGRLSFPQFFLLGYLMTHATISMTEIATWMNHTTAAATGMVDRLECLGYVERWRGDKDRRKVLVKITKKGESLVSLIRKDIIQNLSKMMGILTTEEQETWLNIYRKIYSYCQNKHS